MRLVICLDDGNGMMFNHRRQSRDREVIADIVAMSQGGTLYMDAYSEPLFAQTDADIRISREIPTDGGEADVYFMEDRSPLPYLRAFDAVTVYRWNRRYPADLIFDADWEKHGFHPMACMEFVGSSHEKITKENFER